MTAPDRGHADQAEADAGQDDPGPGLELEGLQEEHGLEALAEDAR